MDKTSQQLEVVSTGAAASSGRTLIVLGHGSHLNADSAQAVRRHAQAVRERGLFGEVLEAYWKEEPSLRQVLRLARFRDVTVVPLFVSEGYFTNGVLPRELGLTWRGPLPPQGVREVVQGRQLHYTRPYGIHPAMSDVILARAAEVCPDWTPQDTALVVLGHGTGRDPHSREAIEQAADSLRQGGHFAEVQALYLDQEPNVSDWPSLTHAPTVIIVPFFASEGWHTLETIPADLGLSGPVTRLGGRTVCYSRPVGTHPGVTEVVLRLVEDSAETEDAAARTDLAQIHPDWQAAGETLAQAVTSGAEELTVGELHITPLPEGGFDLRHHADQGRADLRAVPLQDLSAWTGRSDEGHHRPIRTGRTLPRGW
ncbi:MAG: CbiX/SirB N-terminal domain-containing protein, partial [Deinococcus sp.]|uniref:CbiX/SirB N-terminal domain-containing protein n=1 Tax=Deinococcus sp. TaxID=47478 RepID=UPI0026DD35BC